MKDIPMSKYHGKLVVLSTNNEDQFALLHIGVEEGQERFASFLGLAITKQDEDGTYFIVMLDEPVTPNTAPIIKLAVHESIVHRSEVPWEIFRDAVGGKFTKVEF